ncbi:MAG TPA: thioredoxin fold domain-containing protein [Alphaproteobacteria bacterium]|nr:thioredoxin fold domain-containing protein [Alphaproteobacteria bacterium]
MQLCKRLKFLMLTAMAVLLLSTSSYAAQQPDPAANPVLAHLMKLGAKMFYLGTEGGLDGWFIVKGGQVQIVYSAPDKKSVLIGGLFGDDGDSITANQIKNLMKTNPEINAMMTKAADEQLTLHKETTPSPAAQSASSSPSVALSPGERLIQELSAASGVTIGSGKPVLFMVMDPNCPHCQATWKALRASVLDEKLKIRMVPIGTLNTDNERAAAQFLHATDPLNTWDKYVSGDKSQLAGTPDQALLDAVRANHMLVDNWNIQATPYMVYRAKDGKVKVVQGELDKPEKVSVFLADLGS